MNFFKAKVIIGRGLLLSRVPAALYLKLLL